MIYGIYESPLGSIYLLSENGFLTGLYMRSQIDALPSNTLESNEDPVIHKTMHWLDDYFAGKRPAPSMLPLRPSGTAFQQRVWMMLLQIPYGETVTYGQLAKQFPGKMSAQAVGQAVGKNPISIIIPCHRVLGTNKQLTGYAGGISCKVNLLRQEGIDTSKLLYPKNYRGM